MVGIVPGPPMHSNARRPGALMGLTRTTCPFYDLFSRGKLGKGRLRLSFSFKHCLDTVTDDITEDKGVQTGGMRLHGRVGDLYAQVLVVGVEGGALRVPLPVR